MGQASFAGRTRKPGAPASSHKGTGTTVTCPPSAAKRLLPVLLCVGILLRRLSAISPMAALLPGEQRFDSNTTNHDSKGTGTDDDSLSRDIKSEHSKHHEFLRQNNSWTRMFPCLRSYALNSRRFYRAEELCECNEQWAYLHVLKSGGTTISHQCDRATFKRENPIHKTRHLFTFVRDPIDHFLAGFQECASRRQPEWFEFAYSNRSVIEFFGTFPHRCFRHSAPQVEYLIHPQKPLRYLDRIRFVGDMKDIETFFSMQDIAWNDSLVKNVASNSQRKSQYKNLRSDLNTTIIRRICLHVRHDYCFFDYDPPEICRGTIDRYCKKICNV